MTDKKLIKIILGLLIAILAHNIYLNFEILQVKEDGEAAINYASSAEYFAREAADHASDAADNAFANNCSYCP
ncbi:MAG: hypothetical protein HN542_01025 [Flavobacteriales bacterium]|jgi:hypothetical protein|nr:hypothetical protein [Flavobacteriales bacterium]MBT6132348.1 hypothetical protein [Flavobacteriales bacterium]MBT6382687.1 hypothetical protein [Flavobacteriales bacterium]MBT6917235.1 hypothetical protein [Flavobacteriales bacterium]MBT6980341.1 hypothetical protein [Flavobacteriales bacterium]